MDTLVNRISDLRVHIAPVGFEVDRIALPAIRMRADKVWLLVDTSVTEYVKKIKRKLSQEKIEVKEESVERLDPFSILKAFKLIIEKEKENKLFINVSTGSKVQSIAGMMVSMMYTQFRIIPYYAVPTGYPKTKEEQASFGLKRWIILPVYEIHTPKKILLDALKIIKDEGGTVTKKRMAELVEEKKLITVQSKKNIETARYGILDKNIIQPLYREWKFITIDHIGRNHVIKLTDKGNEATEFLI